MPIISVIVPVYKVEPYLRQCVDSILAQTFTDFELILVDDGSPDNCGKICDTYTKQDSRVQVIHQENEGLSAARNAGIDAANGAYLTFIDSDDRISEDYLKRLYHAIREGNSDIAICNMRSFAVEGELKSTDVCIESYPKLMTGLEACRSIYHMDGKVPIMAWGKLYRANLFRGIRYPVGLIHEDDATTPKLLFRSNKISMIPERLYYYRTRPDSITGCSFSAKRFDCVKAVQSCIEFFREADNSELVKLAECAQKVTQSKMVIRAYGAGQADQIPANYSMTKWNALRYIHRFCIYDTFCWYLSLVYPKLVRPYAYLVKIKQMIALKEN
mgnify:CR=1 FL=1